MSHAFQQCKKFENRLRFDKVTQSLKVGTFFETQCTCLSHLSCCTQCCNPLTSNRHHLSYDDCLENKGRLQDCSCSIGSYHCIQCYAHIYEQLLQVKQICLCLTGFTSLCLDAYVFLCSLVFHCMHVVLL